MSGIRQEDPIAIVGGGIAGLALALGLHRRGIDCHVYEVAPEIKPLGVGITMLPHAMRELSALGLSEAVAAAGVKNAESAFFNRFGQFIYKEERGLAAGYPYPEVGVHRGTLHRILLDAAVKALGHQRIVLNRRCTAVTQDTTGMTVHFQETSTGRAVEDVRASVALACDGVNSAIRRQFYPDEELAFEGINTWRGVARWKPILTGHTYIRIGSIRTGKIVIYPIVDQYDSDGNQLINWTTEAPQMGRPKNDWNKPAKIEDVLPIYKDWHFDWLDVPAFLRNSEMVLEYPMVDKDPVSRWTFGRVTFVGDAAHPMYPRGSNGAAQALIDARTLASLIAEKGPLAALQVYEDERRPATSRIVETNRSNPPDFINIKVEELTRDKPFQNLDEFISQEELRRMSDDYKKIAGFSRQDVR